LYTARALSSPREIQSILAALGEGPAALATLVAVSGSSYRRPGARLLLLPDGRSIGSISGGCLEDDLRRRAREVLADGTPQLVTYDTADEDDLVWGTGLGCGGQVRVFIEQLGPPLPAWIGALRENVRARRDTGVVVAFGEEQGPLRGTRLASELPGAPVSGVFAERIEPPPSLVVFGAGDDAQPLVALAALLGWQVSVFDSRAAYATAARFPGAQLVQAGPVEEVVRHPAIAGDSHVIVMSHRYRDDRAALRGLLARPLAYLGVLGPRHRTGRILDELAEEGIAPDEASRERLYAPVGIDLGGASPETVALSIVAEVQAVRSNRRPQHLRELTRPIHG
jgi:xanthine/CO dehydrogenase XdhC/CoxF family maturation factor